MKKLIRAIIPASVYMRAVRVYHRIKGALRYGKSYRYGENPPGYYLIGAPDHANLGDHAIAQAELEMLAGHPVREIPFTQLQDHIALMRKHLRPQDIMLITGGGNMGVEWFFYEEMARLVIKSFPRNRVVVLPQTIFYGEGETGKRELARSAEIYGAHPDLHLFAREKLSYEMMKKSYPENHVYLAPDMVLSMNRSPQAAERAGILLCLRNDAERRLTGEGEERIRAVCETFGEEVRQTDTVMAGNVACERRAGALDEIFARFGAARLVVTDRLHGMVFAAITGTPCVALSNYNHKVIGVYEWIERLDYIEYLDDPGGLEAAAARLLSLGPRAYDEDMLAPYFDNVRRVLRL